MSETKAEAQHDEAEVAYPLVGWRFAFHPQEREVAVCQIAIAESQEDVAAALEGAQTPALTIAITANQCRDLADDLIETARRLDGENTLD
jgi:hypothetical protein